MRRIRPLHLDDDPAPVGQRRAVDLPDRRGRDRRLLEVEVELLERELELFLDDSAGLLERERRHRVLERLQLEDDVRRDDVGARREELAELDEGRAELVEHLAQPLAARRALRVDLHLAAEPRADGCRPAGLEEVAEPVPLRDLGDLRHAPQLPHCGPGARH